jgi:ribosomal protein S18 acetylase RimI-like enzyme
MDVTIREARAEDAGFLAWVMLAAARSHLPLGFWDLAFPGPEGPRLEILADINRTGPSSLAYYDGFLVAEYEGEAVAGLSGYDSAHKSMTGFLDSMMAVMAERGWNDRHRELAMQRMAPAATCFPDSPPGTWVIEWVAAQPRARGRGVANRLLLEILERGRRAGYEAAQISVIMGNTPAQTAYERVGFRVVEEKTHPDFEAAFGEPGIARMSRALT